MQDIGGKEDTELKGEDSSLSSRELSVQILWQSVSRLEIGLHLDVIASAGAVQVQPYSGKRAIRNSS
jgi:hypothetical protein